MFDDSGVTMSRGWSCNAGTAIFSLHGDDTASPCRLHLSAGLAVSEDGGATYSRLSAAPLLDRSDVDPYLTASPSRDEGRWRMWYVERDGTDAPSRRGAPSLSHQVRRPSIRV